MYFNYLLESSKTVDKKSLLCPSAERLRLSSFGDFLHMYYNKHLIDFLSSESLASVFNSSSFKRSISPYCVIAEQSV